MASSERRSSCVWVPGADGVVENEDFFAIWDVVKNELLDFWVVVSSDAVIINEILLLASWYIAQKLERVFVQVEFAFPTSCILQSN